MMKILSFFLLFLFSMTAFGQGKETVAAKKLVISGIQLHQKGEFQNAISKYDKALKLYHDYLPALAEKAFSLYALNKYNDAIAYCQKAILHHSGAKGLKPVYITYGSVLDAMEKPDKALAIYDEGIHSFPHFYLLYFNRGITFWKTGNTKQAIKNFQKTIILQPQDASAHLALASLWYRKNKRLPAFFAVCRYLSIENQGQRSQKGILLLKNIVETPIQEKKKSTPFKNLITKVFEANDEKRMMANSWNSILSKISFNNDKSLPDSIITIIKKVNSVYQKDKIQNTSSFYQEYYSPYFIAMQQNNFVQPFAYKINMPVKNKFTTHWVNSHKLEMVRLYLWDRFYNWNNTKL